MSQLISFNKCRNTSYKDLNVKEYLLSVKEKDISCLWEHFDSYIASDYHQPDRCCCELKDVGTTFVECIQDSVLVGWTGLHKAVNHSKPKFKKQVITAFMNSYPDMLYTVNNKEHEQTPLMLAANMNPHVAHYLLENFPIDIEKAVWSNSKNESILTYSFNLPEERRDIGDVDISIYLTRKLYNNQLDSTVFQMAVRSKGCPANVIRALVDLVVGEIPLRQFIAIVGSLLVKNDLPVNQFTYILSKIQVLCPDFSRPECLFTREFNIMKEIALMAKDIQNEVLFKTFYSSFLKHIGSSASPDDQKNIAHFACQEDSTFLLEVLAQSYPNDFVDMMMQYDSDNKRPAIYFSKPIVALPKLIKFSDYSIWTELCRDTKVNIIYQIFKKTISLDDLKKILLMDNKLLVLLLQNCNR